jgi:type II secretory ATPase GspE/PulE/Tfp pilus assembly ATPase PilB-like protein
MVWSLLSAAAPVQVGDYLAWWKAIPVLILLLLWGRLVTWIDKDSQEVLLPRLGLNVGNLIGGVIAFALFFMLPGFAVALIALFVILAIEAGVYLAMRNSKVGLGDLGKQFNDWLASLRGGAKEVKVIQGEVQLIGKGGGLLPAPASDDPVLPAYESIQALLTDPLRRNAERVDLVPVDQTAAVRYVVDGVTYAGTTLERSRAAGAIEYMKSIAGMDINEKRKPQSGSMKVSLDGKKRELQIETRGSKEGEQLHALVDLKKKHQERLEELGLLPDQLEIVQSAVADMQGVVLVAAPRGQGLTTMLYAIIRAHDAFLQHLHTIEADPAADLEGVTQNKLPSGASAAEEVKTVGWVISQEPDVIMISHVLDGKSAIQLSKYAGHEGRRVYVGIRANSTFDALQAWRKLTNDNADAIRNLRMIIAGRVMRRLCAACKAAYSPDPTTLRRLNMDPEKIDKLYQARTQPMRDAKGNPIPCDFCKELYFKGRLGIYEVFVVDDDVRAIVAAGGSLNQLKAAFRKQRGKYLQEAALAQVEAGETSVQEVLRVLKQDDKPSGSGGSGRPVSRQPAR